MEENTIRQILKAPIGDVQTIKKLDVGFSNDIYSIDDNFIFKVSRSAEDDKPLEIEAYLCNMFKDKIPAPSIIASDTLEKNFGRAYIIYKKIPGSNLYTKWHLFDLEQKRKIVQQICQELRVINGLPYDDFAKMFNIETKISWKDKIYSNINRYLSQITDRNQLSTDIHNRLQLYLEANKNILNEQTIALTYYDPHFDNVLVRDSTVVGILDFERTDILSIDYVLELVRRMVRYPKKYVSPQSEKYIVAEDYKYLLDWYKEFYPELFAFTDLDKRLDIYSIEHILDDLAKFPGDQKLIEELEQYLN